MHQVADRHRVSLRSVGDRLDAEGAPIDLDPSRIVQEFTAAYIGAFASDRAYTRHRMAELGWTQALRAAGIPENYLNTAAITRDWFEHQVRHRSTRVSMATSRCSTAPTRTDHPLGAAAGASPPTGAAHPTTRQAQVRNGVGPCAPRSPPPGAMQMPGGKGHHSPAPGREGNHHDPRSQPHRPGTPTAER